MICYVPDLNKSTILSQEESQHVAKVLRKNVGDEAIAHDGQGTVATIEFTKIHHKGTEFIIKDSKTVEPRSYRIHIAIAPTKNADRMEWFIEKCTEIGIDEITLIQSFHSERSRVRIDRLMKKAVSAMKQSKDPFLPRINDQVNMTEFISNEQADQKFIAHLNDQPELLKDKVTAGRSVIILIGPEGDFSPEEVDAAIENNFHPVSLGDKRLRTETAGVVSCTILNIVNQ